MEHFKGLKDNIGVLVQRQDDTDYLTKIGVWVNLSVDFLYRSYDWWPQLQATPFNFNTVNGTEDYLMPNQFDKPLRIVDLTNKKPLTILTEEEYFDGNLGAIADGTKEKSPSIARMFGVEGVQIQISTSGDTVKVKSSSSSDTGNFVIRIEGYIDSGFTIIDFEDITISSGSPTTFVAGSTTFFKIIHASKSGDTVGYITIANSSGTTLSTIASFERVLMHKVMKLGKIPNKINSMRVLYKRKNRKLVNDNDYPFVDADDFIILNSQGFALSQEKESVSRAEIIWKKAGETFLALLNNVQGSLGPDYQQQILSSFSRSHRA